MIGRIYKMENTKGLIYIGSTMKTLEQRFRIHKNLLNCSSKVLFENDENVSIELIREVDVRNRKELEAIEFETMKYYTIVNKRLPIPSKSHKGSIQSWEKNKEIMLRCNQVKVICDCGWNGNKGDFWRHKRSLKHSLQTKYCRSV